MSEVQLRIFQHLLTAAAALLYSAVLTALMKPFIACQTRQSYRKKAILLVFFLHLAGWLFCSSAAVPPGLFGPVLLALLLAASRALYMEKSFTFLLVLLYDNARISSGLIVESADFALQRLLSVSPVTLSGIYLHTAAQNTLFTLAHMTLLAIMLYALQQQLRKNKMTLDWRELCHLSLIPAAGILFGRMISVLLFEINNGVPLRLYERHPLLLGIVPVLALLFYTGTFLTAAFWQRLETLRREREDDFVKLQQAQALRGRIHETEQFYTHIRQMKHDMRGHLNNIRGLAKNGQYSDLEQYIAHMDEAVQDVDLTIQTGNAVTDVIINDKRQQCLARSIDFQADFHYPASGGYDAFDLGIILQNLLQNALEACEMISGGTDGCNTMHGKITGHDTMHGEADGHALANPKSGCRGKAYITLSSRQKGKFFLIEVKNPFSGELRFRTDGLPATTKTADVPFHGLGLSSVRREVEKYMGELELKTEHDQFCATILLQERSNQ